jgi:hypothetical protein
VWLSGRAFALPEGPGLIASTAKPKQNKKDHTLALLADFP